MEIKLNINGIDAAFHKYERAEKRLASVKSELIKIMTNTDDYWSGRSGDSFKYICWYLKLLLDNGITDLGKLKDEIDVARKNLASNDKSLSEQIESR